MSDWLNPSDDVLDARSIGFAEGQQSRDEEVAALTAERDALAAELARLRTLEAALPKTADGVPVVPGSGSRLWYIHPDSHTIYERSYTADMRDARSHWIGDHQERHDVVWIGVEQCYSTREAAEAAREAEKARDA